MGFGAKLIKYPIFRFYFLAVFFSMVEADR